MNKGRPITYETGVVAPDGYREKTTGYMCWRCNLEAEYEGYCEVHWEEVLKERAEEELAEREEYYASDPGDGGRRWP